MMQRTTEASSSRREVSRQKILDRVVSELSHPDSYREVYYSPKHGQPMPSVPELAQMMELLQSVLFPGYFGESEITPASMPYYLGANVDRAYRILGEQIRRGYCFLCDADDPQECDECEDVSWELAGNFISALPRLRSSLATDVKAAYRGDPAAKTLGEIIFCYPSITALTHYRIAHELYNLEVDLIPRIITEMSHSRTGIDIHPGARIGDHFFIDHGTGTVIGETCVIGDNVRLYQGVTLGGREIPMDESGEAIRDIPRHPIVEDNVVIYAGASILGRVRIGQDTVIGGNVWITEDVPSGSKVVQKR
jgi:serine O-acetyltransferase